MLKRPDNATHSGSTNLGWSLDVGNWSLCVAGVRFIVKRRPSASSTAASAGQSPGLARCAACRLRAASHPSARFEVEGETSRPQLSPRDRSLVTVSALIAMNRPEQLRYHLLRARDNGVTEEDLSEVMTHLAFYAGWPSALTAVTVDREVFQKK